MRIVLEGAASLLRNPKIYEVLHHSLFSTWKLADLVDWADADMLSGAIYRVDQGTLIRGLE